MTTIFITLLNMSITAGVTALAVMLARAAFKKLPKRLTCALWALVGLRLALPFTWESALSLIPRASSVREAVSQAVPALTGASPTAQSAGGTTYFMASNFAPATVAAEEAVPTASFDRLSLFTAVWLAGAALMLGYLIVSALLLKRRVGACVETEPGVFVADGLASPFVLGLFRPRIYLPPSLAPVQKEMILAHEKAHLKRRDHLVKPFAFLLLAVYWFNPVLWIAYALLCRDIELACDERVIRDMDREEKAFYSQTLLDCGSRHRRVAACPVAFGEVGVKERVKNVLNYKKPAFWIILVAVIAAIALALCFLTDPKTEQPDDTDKATLTDSFYDETLDEKIFTTMQAQSNGKYLEGECYTEAHHIFGTEEKDGKTVVYALVRETWFGFVNGYFTAISGSQCPMALTFDGDECSIERALDGGGYADSLKALFPAKYADAILQHGDRFNEKLWNDVAEQARAYLHYIERSAIVCHTSEAGLSTLTDHGVSAEVSNKLTARFDKYPFYGTEEHIENGVRYLYSVSYDEQTKQIVYEKTPVGENPAPAVERIVVNGETGEIISTYSAPTPLGSNIKADPDWIESAIIDERTIDVDDDGVEDRCVMSYGPTSGLFTFWLTITPVGADEPKYQGIFLTDWSKLSFPVVFADPPTLYVQAVNPLNETEIKNYIVLIENGELVLANEDGDMPHWPGETQVLGLNKLRRQYPELFTLNAEKGLDVYVWPWGVTDGTDREPAYRCWLTESTDEQRETWKEYRIIPDNKNGLSSLSPEDMKVILAFYDIPAKKITVIPYQHPLSSYLWVQDGEIVNGDVTMEDLRAMFGL